MPYITQAIKLYVIPHVSQVWYNEIVEKYHNDPDSMSPSELDALDLLKTAVAYYAAMYAYPKETDFFSNVGNNTSTPTHSQPTSVFTFKSKLWNLTLTADDHLDALLRFMEQRVIVEDESFASYGESEAFNVAKKNLFFLPSDFQVFHNIGNSRRTFNALQPYIQDAARLSIVPIVGKNLYKQLVEQYKDAEITPANAELLAYVCPALAKYSIKYAADADGLNFDYDAPRLVSNSDGIDARKDAVNNRLKARASLALAAENIAKSYVADLKDFLNENAENYPLYQSATTQTNRATTKIVATQDDDGVATGGIGLF